MAAKNFSLHNVSPAAPIIKPKAAADGKSATTQTYRFIIPIIPAVESGKSAKTASNSQTGHLPLSMNNNSPDPGYQTLTMKENLPGSDYHALSRNNNSSGSGYNVQSMASDLYVEMEVNCNAMEEAGIRYGDHIRVLRKDHCSNGQIIIALLNGQMLLRRYQTNGYQVQLVPDSPGLASIEVDTRISDFRVWGLVTHIIRKI